MSVPSEEKLSFLDVFPRDSILCISEFLPKEMRYIFRTSCKTLHEYIHFPKDKINANTLFCWAKQQKYEGLCDNLVEIWGANKESFKNLQKSIDRLCHFANQKFFIDEDGCINVSEDSLQGCLCTMDGDSVGGSEWLKDKFNIDCKHHKYWCVCEPDIDEIEARLQDFAETQKFEYEGELIFKFHGDEWKMFNPTYLEIIQEAVKHMNSSERETLRDCFLYQVYKFGDGIIEISLEEHYF